MFQVAGTSAVYLLPFILLHSDAVAGTSGGLESTQLQQVPMLHLAQLFGNNAASRDSGFIYLNNAWVPVTNIVIAGDYNIDFSNAAEPSLGAIAQVSPTAWRGGSATPVAAPGTPEPVPAQAPSLNLAAPDSTNTSNFAIGLKAAITQTQTHLQAYNPAGSYPPYTDSALDNFFYGGARASNAVIGANGDSGTVIDIPGQLVPPANPSAPAYDVSLLAQSYAALGLLNTADAPGLQAGAAASAAERLIGANLLSDHLPILITIPCP
jgi:hypothetical protein